MCIKKVPLWKIEKKAQDNIDNQSNDKVTVHSFEIVLKNINNNKRQVRRAEYMCTCNVCGNNFKCEVPQTRSSCGCDRIKKIIDRQRKQKEIARKLGGICDHLHTTRELTAIEKKFLYEVF